jgi:predicted Mrr-cat superfamily restriction endonuclease
MFFNKKLKMKKEELEQENIQLRQIIHDLNTRITGLEKSYLGSQAEIARLTHIINGLDNANRILSSQSKAKQYSDNERLY